MPGPDDTMRWLRRYIKQNGYHLDLNELSLGDLQTLRLEAEATRCAERGLCALLQLYSSKSGDAAKSSSQETVTHTAR